MEGGFNGKVITNINMSIDPVTKDVIRNLTTVANVPNSRDVAQDPDVEKMVDYWVNRGSERYAEPVAQLTGDISITRNANGESALGDLVADSEYATGRKAHQPADFALLANLPYAGTQAPLHNSLLYNKGTSPSDQDGLIQFGEAWNADGYANPVVVVTLTGRQIEQVLEQQWVTNSDGTISFYPLAVSGNVHESYDTSKPVGNRIDPGNVIINGKPLDLDKSYRVAALVFLLKGNNGFKAITGYTNPQRVMTDQWSFIKYLQDQKVIVPPTLDRMESLQPLHS